MMGVDSGEPGPLSGAHRHRSTGASLETVPDTFSSLILVRDTFAFLVLVGGLRGLDGYGAIP